MVEVKLAPNTPAPGAHISLSGASAETDSAPSRPQPPRGCVQRICGTRDGPAPPIRPPNCEAFHAGVGIVEVRVGLTEQQRAERAVGIAQAGLQAVRG